MTSTIRIPNAAIEYASLRAIMRRWNIKVYRNSVEMQFDCNTADLLQIAEALRDNEII